MAELNEVIHQPMRLKIMSALNGLPTGEQIEFVRLVQVIGTTEGNLGAHINTLEKAGYIEVEKDFVGKKPRTRVRLSIDGRQAFHSYLDFLRGILAAHPESNA